MTLDTEIILIAAIGNNNEIGAQGRIPWHIPDDLMFFRRQTMGHPVIMGRKTHQSLEYELDGRQEIVVTKDTLYRQRNVLTVACPEDATTILLQEENQLDAIDYSKVYVAGGEQIYKAFMPFADKLLITRVDTTISDADAFFPKIDLNEWDLVKRFKEGRCIFEEYTIKS